MEECPELNRATWAIVQIDQHGNRTKWLRGTVDGIYPQTAQAVEFFAAMYSKAHTISGATLHDDCLNVVKAFQRTDWSDEKHVYGGVMRAVRRIAAEDHELGRQGDGSCA